MSHDNSNFGSIFSSFCFFCSFSQVLISSGNLKVDNYSTYILIHHLKVQHNAPKATCLISGEVHEQSLATNESKIELCQSLRMKFKFKPGLKLAFSKANFKPEGLRKQKQQEVRSKTWQYIKQFLRTEYILNRGTTGSYLVSFLL